MGSPRLPQHVEEYLQRGTSRLYTEEQLGAAVRRVAREITERAHARYSSQLVGAALGALFTGVLLGLAAAEVFRG